VNCSQVAEAKAHLVYIPTPARGQDASNSRVSRTFIDRKNYELNGGLITDNRDIIINHGTNLVVFRHAMSKVPCAKL
jgi:hypothetical protein